MKYGFKIHFVNTVDIYNTVSSTWTTATLSVARANATATALGNKIYIAGGVDALGGLSDVVDVYDVNLNTWTIETLSQPRAYLSSAAVGSNVIFAGGSTPGLGTVYDYVDILDTQTNTWSTATLTTPRAAGAATSIGNKFLYGGGLGATGFPLTTVEVYTIVGVGLVPISKVNSFSISPNPAINNLDVSVVYPSTQKETIEIYNSIGKKVYSQLIQESKNQIDVSNFSKGIYLLKAGNETTKFEKQ